MRLARDSDDRTALYNLLIADQQSLATAMLADLFCGPARNVLIFWADLFGLREVYNQPGQVNGTNWSLRVPDDFQRAYEHEAPDLAQALIWALQGRGLDQDAEGQSLVVSLQRGIA